MADYYLITYRDDTWRNEMGRYTFGWTNSTYNWPDTQNDKLSSFKYRLPAGWELRIHEHRDRNSRYKAWRGNGAEIQVNKADLPSFIHDAASAHTWIQPNYQSVAEAFSAIQPELASAFQIKRGGAVVLPAGYNGDHYHQQGIQKTNNGEFVVSGSARDVGYLYFTDANRSITKVLTPQHGNFNHLGGFQVTDNILAVGYERLENGSQGTSKILFFDLANISQPLALSHLTITRNQAGSTAGAVALVRLPECWLVAVANWNAVRLDFYTSNSLDLHNSATRFSANPVTSWSKAVNGFGNGSSDQNWGAYQNINLFSQIGQTPRPTDLWLIGMHTDTDAAMADWADLYQLNFSTRGVVLTKRNNRHFIRTGSGPRFLYGSGFYFDRTAKAFEIYACEARLSDNATTNRCNLWL